MNDTLDTLSAFRPEAAGPTDALQLHERTAFMESIASSAPRRTPRLRPRRRLALGLALGLLAVVGTAGATGLVPDDVQQALGLASSHSPDVALTPEAGQAVEQTSAPIVGGGTVQLWTAPTTGGGTCAYLRRLDASGAPASSGPTSCALTVDSGGQLAVTSGSTSAPSQGAAATIGGHFGSDGTAQADVDTTGATAYGQAPAGTAKVELVDASGVVLADATPSNGWFVLSGDSSAATVVAQSATGTSLGTLPLTAPAAG